MKRFLNDYWPLLVMLALIALAVYALFAIANEMEKRKPEVFAAWVKLTGNTNLTFSQWSALYDAKALPGQPADSSVTVIPIVTR